MWYVEKQTLRKEPGIKPTNSSARLSMARHGSTQIGTAGHVSARMCLARVMPGRRPCELLSAECSLPWGRVTASRCRLSLLSFTSFPAGFSRGTWAFLFFLISSPQRLASWKKSCLFFEEKENAHKSRVAGKKNCLFFLL